MLFVPSVVWPRPIPTYLVRKGQGQLDLVSDGLSIATALDRSTEHGGVSPQGRTSEAEGVHCGNGLGDGDGLERSLLNGWCCKGRRSEAGCSLARITCWLHLFLVLDALCYFLTATYKEIGILAVYVGFGMA